MDGSNLGQLLLVLSLVWIDYLFVLGMVVRRILYQKSWLVWLSKKGTLMNVEAGSGEALFH
jgi:hypothetical protein